MTNQCHHGQLARVCELCEKDAHIAELQAENERLIDDKASLVSGMASQAAAFAELNRKYAAIRSWQESILRKANTHPFNPIGHVIEHVCQPQPVKDSVTVPVIPINADNERVVDEIMNRVRQPLKQDVDSLVRCGFCNGALTGGDGVTVARSCCEAGRKFDMSIDHPDGPLPLPGGTT